MHIPRAEPITFIPKAFFPISGNDTLQITCTPGPCSAPNGATSATATCVAIFTSIEKSITQSVNYCVEQEPQPSAPPEPSNFQTFKTVFVGAFGVFVMALGALLALAVAMALLFGILVFAKILFDAIMACTWFSKSKKVTAPATTTTTTTTTTTMRTAAAPRPASGQESAGSEMVDLPSSSARAATGSPSADENTADSASLMSDDATQYDESETAQLISTKETV